MVFTKIEINGMKLANRFVRSATCDFSAEEDGSVSDAQTEIFAALSRGSIGMIVTGHLYVRLDGKASPGMAAVDSDECISGLERIADAVHDNGPSKVVAQINHGGRQASERFGIDTIVAPSPIAAKEDAPVPHELSVKEIDDLVACFGDAARRVQKAGFDGVQIHGAHGYFVNQFLSPGSNRRSDEYGGNPDNRMRFLSEVYNRIRSDVGESFPVLIKLGVFDKVGLTLEAGVEIARQCESLGIDAIEVSGGFGVPNVPKRIRAGHKEGPFRSYAKAVKEAVHIPVISVNGYRSLSVMEEVLESGDADMISLCRPFIREPALVADLESGEKSHADCISCNGCFTHRDRLMCTQIEPAI